MKYLATIGIECHVQFKTKTKLFCACDNDSRESKPNTNICPTCFGLPGALPRVNAEAINYALRAGAALDCMVAEVISFDRKHYFYPDLPLGYQITQMRQPVVLTGEITLPKTGTTVAIHHAHLEADAGKNTHPTGADYSLVDLNRASTPLLEIVSEPDMHTPQEAREYARELYLRMKYAEVSDVDLFQGNMRFDINVSVAPEGVSELGTRTETKNLNSFKSIERAAAYEISRQTEVLSSGGLITQETRGWDDAKQKTISQRGKEHAHDYRYMPEPDIPPITITTERVKQCTSDLIKPSEIREQLRAVGLDTDTIETLIEYPEVVSRVQDLQGPAVKFASNLFASVWFSQDSAREFQGSVAQLQDLYELVAADKLSSTNAKVVFLAIAKDQTLSVEAFTSSNNLLQVSDDSALDGFVAEVLAENQQAAQDVRAGELKAIGFLVGQVMKKSKGQANPAKVQELLRRTLSE